MALKEHGQAASQYFEVLEHSPLARVDLIDPPEEKKEEKLHFNSQSCFAHTWSNLAVVFLLMSINQAKDLPCENGEEAVRAAQSCIGQAIKFMPADEGSEAYINMNNVMRQMGCQKQAFEYTWMQVEQTYNRETAEETKFEKPQPLICPRVEPDKAPDTVIDVVCVKYGTKYGADYVNKLYWGIKTYLKLPYRFSCFTEDAEGLDPDINIKQLKHSWKGWWSKVHIFDSQQYAESGKESLVFYIDLDMIITGSLDDLCTLMSAPGFTFATLSTDEIFCETAEEGYNSSVMLFKVAAVEHLYTALASYYAVMLRFLMRFDHYLEMLVWDAALLQKVYPGQILDYTTTFGKESKNVPADCRVIAFPRNPKPHEITDEWVHQLWIYKGQY